MYIKMEIARLGKKDTYTEITTFYGIRQISEGDMAVLSTSHVNHDYIINCDSANYERLVEQLTYILASPNHPQLIELKGGHCLRIRKGNLQKTITDKQYNFKIVT